MESGLHYFDARSLASGLARFISVDLLNQEVPTSKIGTPQNSNPYSYCVNRPLKLFDPSGQAGEASDIIRFGVRLGITAFTAWSHYKGDTPEETLRTAAVLGLELNGDTSSGSITRAVSSLNAAFLMKKEIRVDVAHLLKTEPRLSQNIANALAEAGPGSSGSIRLEQEHYRNKGNLFAYGGITLHYAHNRRTGLVRLSVNDRFQWSPQADRITRALHKLAAGEVREGRMSEPALVGRGAVHTRELPLPAVFGNARISPEATTPPQISGDTTARGFPQE